MQGPSHPAPMQSRALSGFAFVYPTQSKPRHKLAFHVQVSCKTPSLPQATMQSTLSVQPHCRCTFQGTNEDCHSSTNTCLFQAIPFFERFVDEYLDKRLTLEPIHRVHLKTWKWCPHLIALVLMHDTVRIATLSRILPWCSESPWQGS